MISGVGICQVAASSGWVPNSTGWRSPRERGSPAALTGRSRPGRSRVARSRGDGSSGASSNGTPCMPPQHQALVERPSPRGAQARRGASGLPALGASPPPAAGPRSPSGECRFRLLQAVVISAPDHSQNPGRLAQQPDRSTGGLTHRKPALLPALRVPGGRRDPRRLHPRPKLPARSRRRRYPGTRRNPVQLRPSPAGQ